MMFPKSPKFESERWRRAVASLPCAACMKDGPSQCAHANHRGKGFAMKAPDCFTFPLCPDCHREFDQGTKFGSKYQKHDLADEWIIGTLLKLASEGLVKAWSPLTDDGDALRLAVKLGLRIAVVGNDRAEVDAGNDDDPLTWQAVNEQRDIYAATRRAIVRAAAAIGAGK